MSLTNKEIQDLVVDHQIDFQFYSNGVVRDLSSDVNDDDDTLFALLLAALLLLSIEDYTPARAEAAMAGALTENRRTYARIDAALKERMLSATLVEATFQQSLLARAKDAAPMPLDAVTQAARVIATPAQGATVADTMAGLMRDREETIRRGVHNGYAARRTPLQIIDDLRGTRGAAYLDGALQSARRSLETVIRSMLAHAATLTAQAFYVLNGELSNAVVWLSVLDGRTTEGCIVRAGKRYTADAAHAPIGHSWPWEQGPGRRHYNCRSTFAPLVPGERPTDNSYDGWLRRQSAERQDEILGKARGAIYRKGDAPVEAYVNNKSRWITLDQLAARGQP